MDVTLYQKPLTYHELIFLYLCTVAGLSVSGDLAQRPTELGRVVENNGGVMARSLHPFLFIFCLDILCYLEKNKEQLMI